MGSTVSPNTGQSGEIVRFGVFEADLRSGELRKNGVKVKIQALPFRLLKFLLSRPNEVLNREQLREVLWPDGVFVDFDRGVYSTIARLREALGDTAENPVFLETVGRLGYRWIAPAQYLPAEAKQAPAQQSGVDHAIQPDQEGTTSESDHPAFTARYVIGLNTPARKRRWPFGIKVGAALALTIALAGFVYWRYARTVSISSIAVLPFDNLGPAADEAFSDGLTDEITASISQVQGIRVTGRRSAYVFKGKHSDLRDIGARLNVGAILEGSVQRVDQRTHVNVELSRTRDGFTIWSHTYDGTSTDWIQIESEIANSIAHALARNVVAHTATAAPPDPDAHALYLQARYQWNQRNFTAELNSVDLMQQAIARDPRYALAWAGLADSLAVIGDNEDVSPSAYMPRARDAALKAAELDPSLAEAHAVLGMIACHYDYDWPTAEREYKKAFELNPSYASGHQYYALGLMAHGRFAEAKEQLEAARRLDPLALIVDVDDAVLRKFQRDYDGVIAESQSILQRDPNFVLGYSMLTTGYYITHRWDEWRSADAKAPQDDFTRNLVNGNLDEARHILNQEIAEADAGLRRPFGVFRDAVRLKDKALALDWLERSYQNRDYWLLFINVEPEMDSIRSEPRFQAIVHRLGLS